MVHFLDKSGKILSRNTLLSKAILNYGIYDTWIENTT